MSNGIRHYEVWRKGWKVALPLSLSAGYLINPIAGLGLTAGYWIGRYIDPDLDQVSTTSSEGRMINELPIIGHILYGYWSIYGAVCRRLHRSFWTHSPILSTLIRFIYQFWIVFAVIYWKNLQIPNFYEFMFGVFFGLCWSDFLHWLEDKFPAKPEKSLRRR